MVAKKPPLSPDEILMAEFEYAANSAFQANEDRSKAASFFLVSVGSLVAAIFGTQLQGVEGKVNFLLAGLFVALTILGWMTVRQLARLREAWRESARTMNRIKDYYFEHFEDIQLREAFRWRTDTIPNKFKSDSISYYTAIEVSLLCGLTFGAGTYFLLAGFSASDWLIWILTPLMGGLAIWFQLGYYKHILTKRKKENT